MRALAFTAGDLDVVDKPDPEPGRDEVVVRVARCGICGSDLHLAASGLLPAGSVMGHEFAGTVEAVGSDVRGLSPGDRIAAMPTGRCDGSCPACSRGRTALCGSQGARSIGLGLNDGAYAELVRVLATSCFRLPPQMSFDTGALVEPYAVALHAVRRSGVTSDTGPVAIIGAGPIGLLLLAALRYAGITDVVVAEPSATRAALAASFGAGDVFKDARALVSRPEPAAVVFDCAGVAATTPVAVEAARPGGTVVLVGAVNPGETLPMPGLLWLVKEVDVIPALGYETAEFGEAVEHLAAGAVDESALVSEVIPLERGADAFAALGRPGGPVKVMFDPIL